MSISRSHRPKRKYPHEHYRRSRPFIDAWLKVHPDEKASARKFLERFPESMNENGVGTISEVFDAREPHTAGGCIAQAWSVAEVLRSWVKTV